MKKGAFLFLVPLIFASSCGLNKATKLMSKVRSVSNPTFGNVDFEISSADFVKAGFNYDDLIDVTIKDYDGRGNNATFNTAFVKSFNETGYFAPCLCNYEGTKEHFELNFAINPIKNISDTLIGKDVEFKIVKRGGYRKRRQLVNVSQKLTYEELAGDNSSFANFRDVAISGAIYEKIVPQRLYRGSSPFNFKDNPDGRHKIADDLMNFYNIDNEISLSCTLEDINDKYMNPDETPHTYRKWENSYLDNEGKLDPNAHEDEDKSFYSVNLGTDFFSINKPGVDGDAVKNVFVYMAKRIDKIGNATSKFYFHCNEGKDRTAFMIMLLEALAHVPLKDIVVDYMMTFKNYYNVSVVNNKDKYDSLAELGIYRYLYSILVKNPLVDLNKIDWYTFDAKAKVSEICDKDNDALYQGAANYLEEVIKVDHHYVARIVDWLIPKRN